MQCCKCKQVNIDRLVLHPYSHTVAPTPLPNYIVNCEAISILWQKN